MPKSESSGLTTPFSLSGLQTPTLLAGQTFRSPTVISRNDTVSSQDLMKSTQYIVVCYLAPSTSPGEGLHEIFLVPNLRINSFTMSGEREPRGGSEIGAMVQVPGMFHVQKECVLGVMEQVAF
jgi:hypothetical protein